MRHFGALNGTSGRKAGTILPYGSSEPERELVRIMDRCVVVQFFQDRPRQRFGGAGAQAWIAHGNAETRPSGRSQNGGGDIRGGEIWGESGHNRKLDQNENIA